MRYVLFALLAMLAAPSRAADFDTDLDPALIGDAKKLGERIEASGVEQKRTGRLKRILTHLVGKITPKEKAYYDAFDRFAGKADSASFEATKVRTYYTKESAFGVDLWTKAGEVQILYMHSGAPWWFRIELADGTKLVYERSYGRGDYLHTKLVVTEANGRSHDRSYEIGRGRDFEVYEVMAKLGVRILNQTKVTEAAGTTLTIQASEYHDPSGA